MEDPKYSSDYILNFLKEIEMINNMKNIDLNNLNAEMSDDEYLVFRGWKCKSPESYIKDDLVYLKEDAVSKQLRDDQKLINYFMLKAPKQHNIFSQIFPQTFKTT